MFILKTLTATFLTGFIALAAFAEQAEQYEVLPHRGDVYGHVSASEGLAYVASSNSSFGNRFTLGIDLMLGKGSRYDLGWRVLDAISSGENSGSVGDISRNGSGPTFGYFFVPDKWWINYSFDLSSIHGSRVSGGVGAYGHQFEVGYRFYSSGDFNLGAKASYLYVPSVTVPVLDVNSNTSGSAVYPSAQIMTVGIVLGYDLE